MVWIILLFAIVISLMFIENIVKTLDAPRDVYEPGISTVANYEKYRRQKANLALERTLYMWLTGFFWMIFTILWN